MAQRILVVDVGGTHLKILASGQQTPRKVASGQQMTARLMCNWVRKAASDWPYDVAAIGYPGYVVHGKPVHEPYNLGKGWVGFDYAKGLGCPVKVINDAAMQAVGSYEGGRIHHAPLRYYVWLPLLRIADMWLRPRTELLPLEARWWNFDDDPQWIALTLVLGVTNLLYIAAALLGLVRG